MPKGVVLTLGGAPETWHAVEDLPGLFHPVKPVPVFDGAKKFADDPGCPVGIVTCKQQELDASVAELAEQRPDLVRALKEDRANAPVEQVEAVLDAVNHEVKE